VFSSNDLSSAAIRCVGPRTVRRGVESTPGLRRHWRNRVHGRYRWTEETVAGIADGLGRDTELLPAKRFRAACLLTPSRRGPLSTLACLTDKVIGHPVCLNRQRLAERDGLVEPQ
jgi:hypothetical protein